MIAEQPVTGRDALHLLLAAESYAIGAGASETGLRSSLHRAAFSLNWQGEHAQCFLAFPEDA